MEKMLTDVEQYVVDFVFKMRTEKQLTQEDVGFILGVHHTFIYQVENRKSRAKYNLNHINRLADHWGMSIKDFFPEKPFPISEEKKVN